MKVISQNQCSVDRINMCTDQQKFVAKGLPNLSTSPSVKASGLTLTSFAPIVPFTSIIYGRMGIVEPNLLKNLPAFSKKELICLKTLLVSEINLPVFFEQIFKDTLRLPKRNALTV